MKEQPLPGTTGDNRPDLTINSPCGRKVMLVEVSCPFEGSPAALEDAAAHKVSKYEPLRRQLLQSYSEVTIHPFIVGSLGSWFPGNNRVLSALRISYKYAALMRRLCVVSAIAGSQTIWYQAICKSHQRPAATHDNQPSACGSRRPAHSHREAGLSGAEGGIWYTLSVLHQALQRPGQGLLTLSHSIVTPTILHTQERSCPSTNTGSSTRLG